MNVELQKRGPIELDNLPERDCDACKKPFKAGDYLTLVPLGPSDDEEARERSKTGRPYNAICAVLHWECSEGPRQEATK